MGTLILLFEFPEISMYIYLLHVTKQYKKCYLGGRSGDGMAGSRPGPQGKWNGAKMLL